MLLLFCGCEAAQSAADFVLAAGADAGSDSATGGPQCRIAGGSVNCGLALSDVADSLGWQLGIGPSPRAACTKVCSQGPGVIKYVQVMLGDLTACARLVTIENAVQQTRM